MTCVEKLKLDYPNDYDNATALKYTREFMASFMAVLGLNNGGK